MFWDDCDEGLRGVSMSIFRERCFLLYCFEATLDLFEGIMYYLIDNKYAHINICLDSHHFSLLY